MKFSEKMNSNVSKSGDLIMYLPLLLLPCNYSVIFFIRIIAKRKLYFIKITNWPQ